MGGTDSAEDRTVACEPTLHAVRRLSSSVSIEALSGKTMVFPVSAVRGGMCMVVHGGRLGRL